MTELATANWRKSTYSNGANGACVEVAGTGPVIGVRDTKDRQGGTLVFGTSAWTAFMAHLKAGRFDR